MRRFELLDVECAGDTLILTPTKSLGEFRCLQLDGEKRRLLQMFDEVRLKNVVIDFQAVEYVGSTALALIVSLGERVRKCDGLMAFRNASSHVLEILQVANLLDGPITESPPRLENATLPWPCHTLPSQARSVLPRD